MEVPSYRAYGKVLLLRTPSLMAKRDGVVPDFLHRSPDQRVKGDNPVQRTPNKIYPVGGRGPEPGGFLVF